MRDAYESYIADNLRIIGENTARFGGGGYMKHRWGEVVDIANRPPETRTSDEIKEHMKDVLGNIGKR